jgi:DNA-binding winged helix-turn-helix (wHTH) protein
VTDAALTQCIKDIRRQLGDDASNPRYIRTIPKHGYIFIGNVVPANADESMVHSAQAPQLRQTVSGPLAAASARLSLPIEASINQTSEPGRQPARP